MKKIIKILFILLLLFPITSYGNGKKITILHANDLHSHILGFSPNIDYSPSTINDDKTVGGWARIATVIKNVKKEKNNPVLVLDGGDFLMGSLYHMISREYAVELKILKAMGYDAITLGNHEFDLMPSGLAKILNIANDQNGLPDIVSSNVIFSKENAKDDTLEAAFKKGLVKPYKIIEKDGLKIGIFGLVGKDAAEVAPFAKPVKFGNLVEYGKKMVALLRNEKKVDIVICLSHSGLNHYKIDSLKSEDVNLANSVPGIDVIISGHSHTKIEKPIIKNGTIIVQAWAYGMYTGQLDISYENKKVKLISYKNIKIDDTILGDPYIANITNRYRGAINMKILKYHNLGFKNIIANTNFNLDKTKVESNLGNLITDSIVWYSNKFVYDPKDPDTKVVIGIESNGVIRDSIKKGKTGKISVSDAFRSIPLGIGMDGSMAYPLISFYLTASEIKKGIEILTSVAPAKSNDYYLQFSGLRIKYNPNRMMFDRVTQVEIGNIKDGYKPFDYSSSNKKLYRVAANIYNSTFLSIVGNYTFGTLTIVPKNRDGSPIKKLVDVRIDKNKDKPGIQEVKQWIGFMRFIQNFKDLNGDGYSDIPEIYKKAEGRITSEPSWNPISLLKNGTYVTWLAFGAMILFIIIGFLFYKLIKKIFIRLKS